MRIFPGPDEKASVIPCGVLAHPGDLRAPHVLRVAVEIEVAQFLAIKNRNFLALAVGKVQHVRANRSIFRLLPARGVKEVKAMTLLPDLNSINRSRKTYNFIVMVQEDDASEIEPHALRSWQGLNSARYLIEKLSSRSGLTKRI